MLDWSSQIRPHLAHLNLAPGREAEIVEELAQHAEDRCRELESAGATESEARRRVLEEITGHELLSRELQAVERRCSGTGGFGRGKERTLSGRRWAGPALRTPNTTQEPGIYGGRDSGAGFGHWREYGDFQRHKRRPFAAVGVSRPWQAFEDLRDDARVHSFLGPIPELSRLAQGKPFLQRHGNLPQRRL
jgi:hypothetical protein